MTCNPCSGGKAEEKPKTTEQILAPAQKWGWYHALALQGTEHSLLSCERIQEFFFFMLSLEYSIFTHGNIQVKLWLLSEPHVWDHIS